MTTRLSDTRSTAADLATQHGALSTSTRNRCLFLFVAATSFVPPSHGQTPPDYDFLWSRIGATGNAPYSGPDETSMNVNGRGRVDYEYRMSTLEVTSGQWLEFLNTYSMSATPPRLFSNRNPVYWGGGVDGTYSGPGRRFILNPNIPNASLLPVASISFDMSMLYCNWLHNGKGTSPSAIATGAYDTTVIPDGIDIPQSLYPLRSPDARFWIPSLDEWIKAAHFDPNRYGEGQSGWWTYRNRSEEPGTPGPPGLGTTSAGWEGDSFGEWRIPLGSYTDQMSPWGLLDTSGATAEWIEEIAGVDPSQTDERWTMGPSAGGTPLALPFYERISFAFPENASGAALSGLRIASVVPAPGGVAIMMFGAVQLTRRRRS